MKIERVPVWSGWLRLSHLATGVATLVLLATGWLLQGAPSLTAVAREYHDIAAAILIFGLVVRASRMLLGRPVERPGRLLPSGSEWAAARSTLASYLTLGKLPLPRWYVHNPFWKPLYLGLYLLLLVLVLSGWLRTGRDFFVGLYLPDVHVMFASLVGWWTLLHVLAVVFHDYKGDATDASSIINGRRQFVVDKPVPESKGMGETVIRLDEIGRLNK